MYILLRANEMGFKSRIKLSRPLTGFIKTTDMSHKFIQDAGSVSHYQHPLLMRSIMQMKRKNRTQPKCAPQSRESIKDDLIEDNDQNDISNEEEDEFSEIYGDAPMVIKMISYIGSQKEKHLAQRRII
jgi:hypothetical protein